MILYSALVVGAAPEICAGCPVGADVDQEIVDFAVSQLLGKYKKCFYITVDDFQSQVTTNMPSYD